MTLKLPEYHIINKNENYIELEVKNSIHGVQSVLIDIEDYEWFCQWRWYLQKDCNTFYVVRNSSGKGGIKRTHLRLHVEILKRHGMFQEGKIVDHINCFATDNRKENLRLCDNNENSKNIRVDSKMTENSSSKYKGVSWFKNIKKWVAQIRNNNKSYVLGYFNDEIEAAKAYDMAALFFHKKFAKLNFPDNLYDLTNYKIIERKQTKSSNFIGVTYNKDECLYYANFNGVHIKCGKSEKEVAIARDVYLIKNNLVSNRAKLNFPENINEYIQSS